MKKEGMDSLLDHVLSKKSSNTTLQKVKGDIVKPVEKTFLLSLPEIKLHQLKQIALDRKTTVRSLINGVIDKHILND